MSTATETDYRAYQTAADYEVKTISISEPFRWVGSGFQVFKELPTLSLLYGAAFVVLVTLIYQLINNMPWYTVAYVTGLVVAGPFLASGLYAASRDIDKGNQPTIQSSLALIGQRKTYLALFSLMLAIVMAAWVRFSALLFAIKFSTASPTVESYFNMLGSADGLITLAFFVGIGFLLATSVFVLSAIAIPLILDKDVDFITAMQTSYRAVMHNKAAMAIWAAIIVALVAIGVATAFIGLAVIFPILGYATWRSYRALIK